MNANMHFAKTHLSRLIEQAMAGEDVVIARAGKPLVRLIPCEQAAPPPSTKTSGEWIGMFDHLGLQSPTVEEWAETDRDIEQMFDDSHVFPQDTPEGLAERRGEVVQVEAQ